MIRRFWFWFTYYVYGWLFSVVSFGYVHSPVWVGEWYFQHVYLRTLGLMPTHYYLLHSDMGTGMIETPEDVERFLEWAQNG